MLQNKRLFVVFITLYLDSMEKEKRKCKKKKKRKERRIDLRH